MAWLNGAMKTANTNSSADTPGSNLAPKWPLQRGYSVQMVGFLTSCSSRVEEGRGGGRLPVAMASAFAAAASVRLAVAPFPHPAHRTGRALLTHPALGQDTTPSHTEGHEQPSDQPPGP